MTLTECTDYNSCPMFNRLVPIPSQILSVEFNQKVLQITLDSGATVSYIRHSEVKRLKLNVAPNNQLALLADRKTRMASMGEVDFDVTLGNINLRPRALVMQDLQADCFGGTTFHIDNEIETDISGDIVKIHRKYVVKQSNPCSDRLTYPPQITETSASIKSSLSSCLPYNPVRFNAISLPMDKLVFPSDILHIPIKNVSNSPMSYVSITPSFPSAYDNPQWAPQVCEVVDGNALYKNCSDMPLFARQYSHFKPSPVIFSELTDVLSQQDSQPPQLSAIKVPGTVATDDRQLIQMININKKLLSSQELHTLQDVLAEYSSVFNNNLSEGYNQQSGHFVADFTFSNKPPPNRVFVPQYNETNAWIFSKRNMTSWNCRV